VALYKRFFDQLAVPYVTTRRPDWDKFPGAEYSIAFDTVMPDGRTLQIGTIHLLGESFARTFEIKYEDKDGSLQFVNQTCYGISERCVASVIAIHGDDHGLVLPPNVAPVQVVIVPIVFSRKAGGGSENGGNPVEDACSAVYEELKRAGIRAFLDNSDDRPGAKYYRWEMRGVPLRIELGPRDLKSSSCEFIMRNDGRRKHVRLTEVVPEVQRTLEEIQTSIHDDANEALRTSIYNSEENDAGSESSEEKMAALKRKAERGIVSLFLCSSEECGQAIEEQLGVSVLGEAVDETVEEREKGEGHCVICSRPAKRVYVARAY